MQPFSAPVTATLQAISPGGRWLAVAPDGQRVFVGDGIESRPAITLPIGLQVQSAALSADGYRVAVAVACARGRGQSHRDAHGKTDRDAHSRADRDANGRTQRDADQRGGFRPNPDTYTQRRADGLPGSHLVGEPCAAHHAHA
ncbi:MAG: hypothetical protein V9H69_01100 [Anaerolineae bacterium]